MSADWPLDAWVFFDAPKEMLSTSISLADRSRTGRKFFMDSYGPETSNLMLTSLSPECLGELETVKLPISLITNPDWELFAWR